MQYTVFFLILTKLNATYTLYTMFSINILEFRDMKKDNYVGNIKAFETFFDYHEV